jgi:HD-GYP domain-containing protein (c-di-GMP phosphodiesterase class II)
MKKNIVRPGRTITENTKTLIPVSGLKIGMYVCELDRPWLETPFILQGFKITSLDEIETIAEHCQHVYIEGTVHEWLAAQERGNTTSTGTRKTYQNTTSNKEEYSKAATIHESARKLTRSFLDDVRLGQGINIAEVKKTVSECVSSILRNPDAMMWISKIRNKDNYTAEHSLNVGLLAITFGRHLGANEEELNKLGLAGMLHDVGKMRIPNAVLNKAEKLTPEEFNIMKQHARYGRDILMSDNSVDHTAVDVAYAHHEALDGSGYPRKIKASGISDMTRMVTICDVYDAITSNRIYKEGQSSLVALKILYQNKGIKFDERLVTEFISCIGLYPAGSIVELNNGEVGIVINTNYRNRHLPKVLIVRDKNKIPQAEKVLNLERFSKSPDQQYLIKTVLPNGLHGVRIEQFIKKGLTIE